MDEPKRPFVFLSYRRQDSSAASRWLYSAMQKTFGADSVFMDTESIRTGSRWPATIEEALRRATVIVAVIGPNWLRATDEHGRRRLDKADDWVRNEIAYALGEGVPIIPLIISKTPLPKREALPEPLEDLTLHQAFELRDERWESDLGLLLSELEGRGLVRGPNARSATRGPASRFESYDPLTSGRRTVGSPVGSWSPPRSRPGAADQDRVPSGLRVHLVRGRHPVHVRGRRSRLRGAAPPTLGEHLAERGRLALYLGHRVQAIDPRRGTRRLPRPAFCNIPHPSWPPGS